MREIKMMSGKSIIISDEEHTNIASAVNSGAKGLIQLRNGDLINLSSIEIISQAEVEPYFMGNKMSKNKTKVLVHGEWRNFAGLEREIEYRPKNNNFLKTKCEPKNNSLLSTSKSMAQ